MTIARVWLPLHFGLPVNINKISYLVGKHFIPLSSLSEKLCGLCWRSVKMFICSELWKDSILFSYAASLQDQF